MNNDRVPNPEDEYLTVREVAAILRVCLETVKRRLQDKSLPGVKVGRIWRIRRRDLPTPSSNSRGSHDE